MKKVLITGANSYIGTSFEQFIKGHYSTEFKIDTIDMIDENWREKTFSGYDAIFHVAGIAHADIENASEETKNLYYKVNCELAFDCARKAKADGVGQFLFMSSMIVYPGATRYNQMNVITKDTEPLPDNFYGDSKLQAEKKINTLVDDSFKVVILRPPMIYGRNSKGNYRILSKIAGKLPVFPKVNNQRSMLYVGNLCEFVRLMITNGESGTFFPQNSTYTNTSEMVRAIASAKGRKIWITGIFTPLILLLSCMRNKYGKLVNKAFGSLVYDMSLSEYKEEYRIYSLQDSIKEAECGDS